MKFKLLLTTFLGSSANEFDPNEDVSITNMPPLKMNEKMPRGLIPELKVIGMEDLYQ
jgi:hypothetical protein